MAHMTKYTHATAEEIISQNSRSSSAATPAERINPSQTHLNYSLITNRDMTDLEYYTARKSQVYCANRSDLKTLIEWEVPLPYSLRGSQESAYFSCLRDFFATRYGENNLVQAIVHKDEASRPHLHVCFVPAVRDPKFDGEKMCASSVVTREDLQNIHQDMQYWLESHGINTNPRRRAPVQIRHDPNAAPIGSAEIKRLLDDINCELVENAAESEAAGAVDWAAEIDQILGMSFECGAFTEKEYEIEF